MSNNGNSWSVADKSGEQAHKRRALCQCEGRNKINTMLTSFAHRDVEGRLLSTCQCSIHGVKGLGQAHHSRDDNPLSHEG
jgi:hypothetical protein